MSEKYKEGKKAAGRKQITKKNSKPAKIKSKKEKSGPTLFQILLVISSVISSLVIVYLFLQK